MSDELALLLVGSGVVVSVLGVVVSLIRDSERDVFSIGVLTVMASVLAFLFLVMR